jgi:hypothetical protein
MSKVHTLTTTESEYFEVPKKKFNEILLNHENALEREQQRDIEYQARIRVLEQKNKLYADAYNRTKEELNKLKNVIKSHNVKNMSTEHLSGYISQLERKRKDYNERKEELIMEHIRKFGAQELIELEKELSQI